MEFRTFILIIRFLCTHLWIALEESSHRKFKMTLSLTDDHLNIKLNFDQFRSSYLFHMTLNSKFQNYSTSNESPEFESCIRFECELFVLCANFDTFHCTIYFKCNEIFMHCAEIGGLLIKTAVVKVHNFIYRKSFIVGVINTAENPFENNGAGKSSFHKYFICTRF